MTDTAAAPEGSMETVAAAFLAATMEVGTVAKHPVFSLLVLGSGSAAAYITSSSLVIGNLQIGKSSVPTAQAKYLAEAHRIQAMEASNATVAKTLSTVQSRMNTARATVQSLRQQLQNLQGQLGTAGVHTTSPAASAPPTQAAKTPSSSSSSSSSSSTPVYSAPPVTIPPFSTMTGAS